MSGITGVYAYNIVGRMHFIHLENATRVLESRGPDYHHTYHDNTVALGYRRFSTTGNSDSANQPMQDISGRYLIILDGEISNFKALRRQLEAKGYSFRSEAETEVLLTLYLDQGKEGLQQLNGSFAFAIYDKEERWLLLARDRMGIKPLFIYHDENKLFFASELKSIMAFGFEKELDYNALWQYLQINYISAPKTIFKNVEKLLPGHSLLITRDKVEKDRYDFINYDAEKITDKPYQELKDEFALLMEEAVQQRLHPDLSPGIFHKGDFASSIITSLAARQNLEIKSFSIRFKSPGYSDESEAAQLLSNKYGIKHEIIQRKEKDLLKDLSKVLDYMDEPFADPSMLTTNLLCREKKDHSPSVLISEGADQLFGRQESNKSSSIFNTMSRISKLAWLTPKERYWKDISIVNEKQAYSLLSSESKENIDIASFHQWKHLLIKDVDASLNKQLFADIKMVLPDKILTKLDRVSMKNSLEIRLPFLDKKVVDFVLRLPDEYKMDGRRNILHDAFREVPYFNFPEKEFKPPISRWLKNDLKPMVNELLDDDLIRKQGIFDPGEIKNLKRKLFSIIPGDVHLRIWTLVVFQSWYRRHF